MFVALLFVILVAAFRILATSMMRRHGAAGRDPRS